MRFIIIAIVLSSISAQVYGQFRNSRRSSTPQESTVNYSSPKKYKIGKISITGTNVLDKNALISLSGLRVGDDVEIPGEDISNAIRKLWKNGVVGDVAIYVDNISGDQVDLVIQLSERPRLTRYQFDGIGKTQAGELSDNIDIIKGKILTDAAVKNIELNVTEFFVNKGFLNTEVNIRQKEDTLVSNGVMLLIDVNKKNRVKIDRIEFEGNDNLGTAKLRQKLSNTREKVRFSVFSDLADNIFHFKFGRIAKMAKNTAKSEPGSLKEFVNNNVKLNILKSSKFIPDDFEDDKKSVIGFYNTKGFRDAQLTFDSVYNKDQNNINILIGVDEGQKYYFRNILWTGNYVHNDDVLNTILGIKRGDIYDIDRINRKLTFDPSGPDISGLYMDDGYLFFNAQPVEVGIVGDSIDIEMRIFEGDQATINKIIIAGNDRTNDHVILRELRTYPGQKFSRSDIIRTQQALASLNYFDPEKIDIRPIPNPADGTVDIQYTLEERPSDQVQLSGGWGGQFGFIGTIGLTFNNFSVKNIPHPRKWRPLPIGDGQRLSIRAQANGRQFQSYSFQFAEPWLGGKKPNSFSLTLNNTVQRNINVITNETFGTLKLYSASIGLGRRLEWPDNYFTLSNAVGYTVYVLNDWAFSERSLGFTDGRANSITFNVTLARNSVDNPMFPRSGSQLSLSATFTPPHSAWRDIDYNTATNAEINKWVEYHKWMFDAKYYVTLAGNLVLESKAHLGFIGSYNEVAGVGPFERFSMGGAGLAGQNFLLGTDIVSLRGYEDNVVTPPNFRLQETEVTEDMIDGGIAFSKFAMELRYPVTTGNAATIYIYSFIEGGNNWDSFRDFSPFDLYRSAGLGARVFMPAFGLIGINWGYGFDTLPGRIEPSGPQFQFTIGQQIR